MTNDLSLPSPRRPAADVPNASDALGGIEPRTRINQAAGRDAISLPGIIPTGSEKQ
jgi:hypothetical protein